MSGLFKYVQFGVRPPESKEELSYRAILVYCGTPLPEELFLMQMAPAIESFFPGRRRSIAFF